MSQGDVTEAVRTILDCPREVTNNTNRWNREGRRKAKSSGYMNSTKLIKRRVQCRARSDLGQSQLLSGSSRSFSYQDSSTAVENLSKKFIPENTVKNNRFAQSASSRYLKLNDNFQHTSDEVNDAGTMAYFSETISFVA